MSNVLSQEQRRFQSIKKYEQYHARCVKEMFYLAAELKESTGELIDDRQARILWNVSKTLDIKRRKGLL